MNSLTALLMTLGLLLPLPPIADRAHDPRTGPRDPTTARAPAPGRQIPRTSDHAAEWPLAPQPAVVAGFDPPHQAWSAGHRGVDLLGNPGQPVLAALEGTVTFAATLAGRGVVVVSHGQQRTTYEPVAARVTAGERVARGAVLGTLQASAGHCPPQTCLHWGLRDGTTYLDPLGLLQQAPVRLLPPR